MAFYKGDYICYVKRFIKEKEDLKWNDEEGGGAAK